jgi:cytochrome c oxidase cbb3-type subunit 2
MNGYTGLESQGYGPMPNIGTMQNLTAEEIAAIMNHEKTSWGNSAKKVTPDEVKKLMEAAKKNATN